MAKTVRNVSRDKGGLHMKMVLDTTETRAYAKQVGEAYHVVATNKLLEIMEEVKGETYNFLISKKKRPKRWEIAKSMMKRDMFRSSETAVAKIGHSLVVKETRDKGAPTGSSVVGRDASVSMWSQDEERPDDFTSAGVRGSRARSGKKFEGKIAQYYEGGKPPFQISPGNKGKSSFRHPGYPKLGYMARARRRTLQKVKEEFPDELERKLAPNAQYGSKKTAQMTAATAERGLMAIRKKKGWG